MDLPGFAAAVSEAQFAGVASGPTEAAVERLSCLGGARFGAATAVQAAARRQLARRMYNRAVRAAIKLQAALRRSRINEIMVDVLMALRMLRSGNIFIKFSAKGPYAHAKALQPRSGAVRL